MSSSSNLLALAVQNNADWCSVVCESHGAASIWEPTVWYCTGQPPMFYPNIISLSPACDLQTIAGKILVMEGNISIKDAYDSLDLPSLGFNRLFKAHWLVAPPVASGPLDFRFVSTDDELSRWQRAWNNGSDHNIFRTSLLKNPDVRFVAIYRQGELSSGAIINRTGPVAGITNFFCNAHDFDSSYLTCIAAARSVWPVSEVVTYEREQNLDDFKAIGMKELGALSVYQRAIATASGQPPGRNT